MKKECAILFSKRNPHQIHQAKTSCQLFAKEMEDLWLSVLNKSQGQRCWSGRAVLIIVLFGVLCSGMWPAPQMEKDSVIKGFKGGNGKWEDHGKSIENPFNI